MQKNAAGLCPLDIAEDTGNSKLSALLLNHKSVDAEAERVTGGGVAPGVMTSDADETVAAAGGGSAAP